MIKIVQIAWRYLVSRPLAAALNLLLLSLGLGAITFLLLVGTQMDLPSSATWPASIWWWAPRAARCS